MPVGVCGCENVCVKGCVFMYAGGWEDVVRRDTESVTHFPWKIGPVITCLTETSQPQKPGKVMWRSFKIKYKIPGNDSAPTVYS